MNIALTLLFKSTRQIYKKNMPTHNFFKVTPIKKALALSLFTGFTTLGLVFIVGGTAYVDFDGAFTMMHHILFNNNYWLINPDIDPIINIFPESYFVTLGIALFSLIGIGVLINLGIYFKHINCINTNK